MKHSENFYRLVFELAYLLEINKQKLSTLTAYSSFRPAFTSLKSRGVLMSADKDINIFCRQGLALLNSIQKNCTAQQAVKISLLNEQFTWFHQQSHSTQLVCNQGV